MSQPIRFFLIISVWSGIVFCLLVGLIWWLWPSSNQPIAYSALGQSEPVDINENSESTSEMKQIGLFSLDNSNSHLVRRTSTIEIASNLNIALEQVLVSLLSLPDGTSSIPFGTYLNQVYIDQHSIAYLDFSNHLNKNHIGGSNAEYLTLKAILETIYVNFPDKIKQVQILIDGREIESIAGHFDTSQPLNVQVTDYVFQ